MQCWIMDDHVNVYGVGAGAPPLVFFYFNMVGGI
jgi:hypothetical protein